MNILCEVFWWTKIVKLVLLFWLNLLAIFRFTFPILIFTRYLKIEKTHICGRGERGIRNRLVSLNKKMEKLWKDGRMKEKRFMKTARMATVIPTPHHKKIQWKLSEEIYYVIYLVLFVNDQQILVKKDTIPAYILTLHHCRGGKSW